MKVVIDTNVLVSALLTDEGNPAKIIDMLLDGKITAVINGRILDEYMDVLSREKFNFRMPDVHGLLSYIGKYSEICPAQQGVAGNMAIHEDDKKFLEAAVAGRADFIITGNLKHFPATKYGKCKIVSPAEFIRHFQ
jgi:putative PIN family toxin of toxin-antitoxin system